MLNFFEMTKLLQNEVIEFDRDKHGTGGRTTRAKANLPADHPDSLKDIGPRIGEKGDYWYRGWDEPEEDVSVHDGTAQELARIRDKHNVPGADLARQIYHAINHNINKFQNKAYTFDQLVHELSGLEVKDVDGSFKKLGVTATPQQWSTAIKLLAGATQPPLSAPVFKLNSGTKTISVAEEHPTLTKSAKDHLAKMGSSKERAAFTDRYFDKDEDKKAKPGIRYLGQKVDPSASLAAPGDMPAPLKAQLDQEKKLFAKVADHFDMIKTTGYGGDPDELEEFVGPYEQLARELLSNGWLKNSPEDYERVSQNFNHYQQLSRESWGSVGKDKISPEKDAMKALEAYFAATQNAIGGDKSGIVSAYKAAMAAFDKALADPGLSKHPATAERLQAFKQKLEQDFNPPVKPKPAAPTAAPAAPSVPTAPAQQKVKKVFKKSAPPGPAGNKDFSKLSIKPTDNPFQ